MSARSLVKRAVHAAGLTARLHRLRNRRTLTVAAFHRVLEPGDPRFAEADPEWTVTRALFGECLDFFVEHYRVLSLAELLTARRTGARVPDRSLVISFDDGWADTADTALAELRARSLPGVCFVAARALGRRAPFWREALEAALRRGRLDDAALAELWRGAAGSGPAPRGRDALPALLAALEALPQEGREALLSGVRGLEPLDGPPAMLTAEQLRALEAGGVAIGSHGATHEPLERIADASAELAGSRAELARALGRAEGPRAFSFPHGRFRREQLAQAQAAGYELLFTSEEHLNALDERGLAPVLGRVCIDGRQVAGPDGRLAPERLALQLFRRPRVAAGGTA